MLVGISTGLKYSLYLYPRNFRFKQKYQQHGPCFQTIFPFIISMIETNANTSKLILETVCVFLWIFKCFLEIALPLSCKLKYFVGVFTSILFNKRKKNIYHLKNHSSLYQSTLMHLSNNNAHLLFILYFLFIGFFSCSYIPPSYLRSKYFWWLVITNKCFYRYHLKWM